MPEEKKYPIADKNGNFSIKGVEAALRRAKIEKARGYPTGDVIAKAEKILEEHGKRPT